MYVKTNVIKILKYFMTFSKQFKHYLWLIVLELQQNIKNR